MPKDNYPTEQELERVREFNALDREGIIDFLRSIWNWADWGVKVSGKHVLKLELHTGGWSGNEEIISALKDNHVFWALYWECSKRGGHFYFRMRPIQKRKDGEFS